MNRNGNLTNKTSKSVLGSFEKRFSRQRKMDYYFGYVIMFIGLLIFFYGFEDARREGVIDLRIFIATFSIILTGYLNVYGVNRNPYTSLVIVPAALFFRSFPIDPGWSLSLLLLGGSILAFIVDRKSTFDFYEAVSQPFRKAREK